MSVVDEGVQGRALDYHTYMLLAQHRNLIRVFTDQIQP
jgi:hypothetical protein